MLPLHQFPGTALAGQVKSQRVGQWRQNETPTGINFQQGDAGTRNGMVIT